VSLDLPEATVVPEAFASCQQVLRVEYITPLLDLYTFKLIGAGQALQVIGDKVYLIGDGETGVVQELNSHYDATGWIGRMLWQGVDLINHPTGIAYRDGYPTFFAKGGLLFHVDWDIFYEDKTLDRALIKTITTNDRQVRPEYVEVDGVWYVASTEYITIAGDNEMILMDPEKLKVAETVNDPGVIVHRFPVGVFVQSLHWDASRQRIDLIQNLTRHRGWLLTSIDINKAIEQQSGLAVAVDRSRCFNVLTELEGYGVMPSGEQVFVTGEEKDNFAVLP
jgi:hypothetical protein